MLDQKPLNRLLFIDIETTSQKENFSALTEHQQYLFKKRFKKDIDSEINKRNEKSLQRRKPLSQICIWGNHLCLGKG